MEKILNYKQRIKLKVPLLFIGDKVDSKNRSRVDEIIQLLKDDIELLEFGPVLDELEVIDSIERMLLLKPPAIILDTLQGGSARSIVLASIKSGIPVILWCHDESHSLASSSIAAGALGQMEHPYILVHGDASYVADEIIIAVKSAAAVKKLRNSRIGQLGPIHPNLINACVNPIVIAKKFGTWVVPLTLTTLKKGIKDVDRDNLADELAEMATCFDLQVDKETLMKALEVRSALKDLAAKNRLDAIAVDCWNEVIPELGINPCLELVFNKFILACEGDITLALTMLAGDAICGSPGYCGDFYSFDEGKGIVSLMHCTGSCRLHAGNEPIKISCQKPLGSVGIEGTFAVPRPNIASGPGVILMLHGMNLEYLHISNCEILEANFSNQMQLFIRIEGNTGNFREQAAGNHYVVFPDNCMESWKLWAKWSRIEVH